MGQRFTDAQNWAKLSENNTFEIEGGRTHAQPCFIYKDLSLKSSCCHESCISHVPHIFQHIWTVGLNSVKLSEPSVNIINQRKSDSNSWVKVSVCDTLTWLNLWRTWCGQMRCDETLRLGLAEREGRLACKVWMSEW